MEKIVLLFMLLAVLTVASEYKCNFSFGYQNWPSTKLFYDKNHTIPQGNNKWNVTLTHKHGEKVSFVCVNISNVDLNETEVFYSPMIFSVKVTLLTNAAEDIPVQILAKHSKY